MINAFIQTRVSWYEVINKGAVHVKCSCEFVFVLWGKKQVLGYIVCVVCEGFGI